MIFETTNKLDNIVFITFDEEVLIWNIAIVESSHNKHKHFYETKNLLVIKYALNFNVNGSMLVVCCVLLDLQLSLLQKAI